MPVGVLCEQFPTRYLASRVLRRALRNILHELKRRIRPRPHALHNGNVVAHLRHVPDERARETALPKLPLVREEGVSVLEVQDAMLILLVSGVVVLSDLLRNVKEIAIRVAVRHDVVPRGLKHRPNARVIHDAAIIPNEPRAVQQRHDRVHPRILAHFAQLPPVVRLRDVAIIEPADLRAGANGTGAHVLRRFGPSRRRGLRAVVARRDAVDLADEVPHVRLVLNEPHPLRANAVERIQHLREVLILNALRGALNAQQDASHGAIGLNVLLCGEALHLADDLVLRQHLLVARRLLRFRRVLNLFCDIARGRNDAVVKRHLAPLVPVLITAGQHAHPRLNGRDNLVALFVGYLAAERLSDKVPAFLFHSVIP